MDFTKISVQSIGLIIIFVFIFLPQYIECFKQNKLILSYNLGISLLIASFSLRSFGLFLNIYFNLKGEYFGIISLLVGVIFFYVMSIVTLTKKSEIKEVYEEIKNKKIIKKIKEIKFIKWLKIKYEIYRNIRIIKVVKFIVELVPSGIFVYFFIIPILLNVFNTFENKKNYALIYENGNPVKAILSVVDNQYSVVPCKIKKEFEEEDKYELILYTKYGERVTTENKKVGERYFNKVTINYEDEL